MRVTLRWFAIASALSLTGCGSSADPRQARDSTADVASVEAGTVATLADASAEAPADGSTRTLLSRGLYADMPTDNLLINPTFDTGLPGIGGWISSLGATGVTGDGPGITQMRLSDSPHGPLGIVGRIATWDGGASAGGPFSLLVQATGAAGPITASVWVALDSMPTGVTSPASLVRGVIATANGGGLNGTDMAADEANARVLGGRRWVRLSANVAGPLGLGAFFILHMRGASTRFLLQAPIVMAAPPSGALVLSPSRPLDAHERSLIDHARMLPLRGEAPKRPAPHP